MTNLFVTGGAGFIGSNFIRYWLSAYPDDRIVNYDLLTYAGNLASLQDVEEDYGDRYTFVRGDIQNADLTRHLFEIHRPDYVVNFAAESHNSLAIVNPSAFFQTNVVGTQKLLQAAADAQVPRFHHISTCEVYGDLALDADESLVRRAHTKPNQALVGLEAKNIVSASIEVFRVRWALVPFFVAGQYSLQSQPLSGNGLLAQRMHHGDVDE